MRPTVSACVIFYLSYLVSKLQKMNFQPWRRFVFEINLKIGQQEAVLMFFVKVKAL
jgi:hypothetical protein